MVNATKDDRFPILAIDLLGGCALAACVAGLFWFAVIGADETSERIDGLARSVLKQKQDLGAFRNVLTRQQIVLGERKAELARIGHLPTDTPVESYFQTLSELAERHGLKVHRQHPVSPRQYPGLLEQRYAYELSGSTQSIIKFFRDIENTRFWADVAYFRIGQGPVNAPGAIDGRRAALTLSLFSALPVEVNTTSG